MNLYPANLNISGKSCVVIGGGKVAARKLRSLLACEAKIVLVSPDVDEETEKLIQSNDIIWENRGYQTGDLRGAFLCVAATDRREVQEEIRQEANIEGALLNSADDPEVSDFQVPSSIRRGGLLLTVSTGGASPSLSKSIRMDLEKQYGVEYAGYIEGLHLVRQHILSQSQEGDDNGRIFKRLGQEDVLSHFKEQNWPEIRDILLTHLPGRYDVNQLVTLLQGAWQNQVEIDR